MNKYKNMPSTQEQLKTLDWRKGCRCSWKVNFYGQIMRGINPECRVHDPLWRKFLDALYRALKCRFGG